MNVTLFKTIKHTTGEGDFNIKDIFKSIQNGDWADQVKKVREGKTKDERSNLKQMSPNFTTSGIFRKRGLAGLVKHSGVIAIDFDNLKDVDDVKSYLALDRYSWFTSVSIGGEGLCVFVKIDPDKHLESFNFLSEYYLKNYNLEVDQACKDIPRVRFVMHDVDAILNDSAVRVSLEKEKQFDPERIIGIAENMILTAIDNERHFKLLKAARLMGGYIGGGLLDENVVSARLISTWESREFNERYNYKKTINDGISNGILSPITFEYYQATNLKTTENSKAITIVKSAAREQNRNGLKIDKSDFKQFLSSGLSEKEIEKIFNKVFDEEKHLFGFNDKPKQIKLELTIAERWEFRRNVVLDSCDYRIKTDKNSKFENVNIDTVTRHALTCGQTTTVSNIRSLLQSDFVKEIDPIKDYFNGLDKWDGKTDHIKIFSDHVQVAEEDREFFTSMFKKHLVRSVRQILGGEVNRYVFMLVGEKQDTGKSTFIRKLSPFAKGEYYTEIAIRDDKDGQIAFAENFIYNIEEFNGASVKDANRLKAMISQYIVKERKAYAHGVKVMERRCNFWASTNNAEFLTDTENTRWLCFEIGGINWEYDKLNIDSLWSQAVTLYNDSNYSVALTVEEKEKQSTMNKQHEVATTATDVLIQHFRPAENKEPFSIVLNATEIMSRMIAIVGIGIRIEKPAVLKALTSLGYKNVSAWVDGKTKRGFCVIQEDMTPQPFKLLKPNYEQN